MATNPKLSDFCLKMADFQHIGWSTDPELCPMTPKFSDLTLTPLLKNYEIRGTFVIHFSRNLAFISYL